MEVSQACVVLCCVVVCRLMLRCGCLDVVVCCVVCCGVLTCLAMACETMRSHECLLGSWFSYGFPCLPCQKSVSITNLRMQACHTSTGRVKSPEHSVTSKKGLTIAFCLTRDGQVFRRGRVLFNIAFSYVECCLVLVF